MSEEKTKKAKKKEAQRPAKEKEAPAGEKAPEEKRSEGKGGGSHEHHVPRTR